MVSRRSPMTSSSLSSGSLSGSRPGTLRGSVPETTATIVHLAGSRTSLVKLAPIVAELTRRGAFRQVVVRADRRADPDRAHEDALEHLDLPAVDRSLDIGIGTHADQTGRALLAFERVLLENRPDSVLVSGDANAALACALAAFKLGIPVAHLEAGMRSDDWSTPDEVNRVLTDRICETLFAQDQDDARRLAAEGIAPWRVHVVGSTRVDFLHRHEAQAEQLGHWRAIGQERERYVLLALLRARNLEDPVRLERIAASVVQLAGTVPVVFPVDAVTRGRLAAIGAGDALARAGVLCIEPAPYLPFLSLQLGAGAVVTDAGSIQEETSIFGVPCFTLGATTEQSLTLTHGTNLLLGEDPRELAEITLGERARERCDSPLWDGRSAERIADVLSAQRAQIEPDVTQHA